MTAWRSTTDSLPPLRERVIVRNKNGICMVGYRVHVRNHSERWICGENFWCGAELTHWCRIPKFKEAG